jgi:hypothetical protein
MKHRGIAILLGLAALATGAVAVAEAEDALLKRYPYDPACAWGRVGNGKGMVVRCISEDEAKVMRAAPPPLAAGAKPAPSSGVSSTKPVAIATPTPGSATADASDPDATTEPEAPTSDAGNEALEVTIGPVTAETGSLGIGKLGAPKDKYLACVQKNGGVSGKSAEVSVRFLVRAKGIAEGVSVAKRSNLSKEAAQCVAEVVDRRRVGTPESDVVGATVVVKFEKADKVVR